jgi:chromosome segregation ATPase
MNPMAAAFETSLLGLLLSLVVLIWTQLTGTRTCLERCEALLSSWFETVLPLQMGEHLMTPLRKSLDNLNQSANNLPDSVTAAVHKGMQSAFRDKLNDLFDVQVNLASDASVAVRTLSTFASTLNESGQDFLRAAEAFRQSDFASTLDLSVKSLVETRQQLTNSTEALSKRLIEVRDNLLFTQAEWQLLAKAAENELESSQQTCLLMQDEIKALKRSSDIMQQSANAASESTKQLREARLEVMRDRKLAIEAVEAIQQRLATDNSTAESCKAFVDALEISLRGWSLNIDQLNSLSQALVESVRTTQLEDDNKILERSRLAADKIAELQDRMHKDLGQSIENQRLKITALGAPAHSAQTLAEKLLMQLEELQRRISTLTTTANSLEYPPISPISGPSS